MTVNERDGTKIEWTHLPGYKGETWNPVTGCDRISPGCANCYARTMAKRLKAMGQPHYQRDGDGPGFGVTVHPDALDQPLRWRKPRCVFVNSMSDLFHEEIPAEFVYEVFRVMAQTPQHIFQVLTKRPERARELLANAAVCEHGWLTHNGDNPSSYGGSGEVLPSNPWPIPNVWLGVSIENSRYTWRADVLRQIPAAVRFISAEPLLGSLYEDARSPRQANPTVEERRHVRAPLDLSGIDWVIIGGESGPKARPFRLEHARELIDACYANSDRGGDGLVPAVFVKQLGARPVVPHPKARRPGELWQLRLRDRKGGDPAEWPTDLRIREHPLARELHRG